MVCKIFKSFLILVLVLGLTKLQAQEAIPASGGIASGSGGSISYTVGQVIYSTNSGSNGSVAQGVQQPFEISIVTGLDEAKGIILDFSTYPNPASSHVILKVENYNTKNLTYKLYDNSGKLMTNKKIEGNETIVDLNNLLPATYFLNIIENNRAIKNFKIIKNQ